MRVFETISLVRWLAPALLLPLVAANTHADNLSLKLDGDGSYVELPAEGYDDLSQATVEAWVKWDALNHYSRVFEFGSPWKSMFVINNAKTADLRFNVYPRLAKNDETARNIIWAANAIRTNEWMHLAAVSGPGGMQLYLNGRLVGQHTNTTSFARFAKEARFVLGRGLVGNATDQDFRGEMDEIRLWNYRRSAAQIREGMFKRLKGNEAGLVHLWNFDDGTVRDASSSGADGQLRGNALIGATDLGLVSEAVVPEVVAAMPAEPPHAPSPASEVGTSDSTIVAWWIAGAITLLAAVLAWLAFMFRRSGLGSEKIVGTRVEIAAAPIQKMIADRAASATVPKEMKEQALAELTSFAKESLVQGLFTQRAALLEAQKQAQEELAQLEARLTNLDVTERLRVYEARVQELERQLATRGDEVEGLTKATLQLLRQKISDAREQAASTPRFN